MSDPTISNLIVQHNTRLVCYYQTHLLDGAHVSILPLIAEKTGVTHVILAAIHLNSPPGNITLNDDAYNASKNDWLWHDIRTIQSAEVKVLGMLGGAAQGSFTRLDSCLETFNSYYEPLRQMIASTGLDGIDLDVEEEMSLAGIISLIDRLKSDFGPHFLITLAPVAAALQNKKHLSGFNYEELEKAFGSKIAWYNTQFYCGWGTMETPTDYEEIIERGWRPERIVVGLVTNPANGKGWVADRPLRETIQILKEKYPGFGGVMGWEYFNSITEEVPEGKPWCWAQFMAKILQPSEDLGKEGGPEVAK